MFVKIISLMVAVLLSITEVYGNTITHEYSYLNSTSNASEEIDIENYATINLKLTAYKKSENKKTNSNKKSSTKTNNTKKTKNIKLIKILKKNTIEINGVSKTFLNLGKTTTATAQKYLNKGNIVASCFKFSGTDNETTYFLGHNPGAFAFMAARIHKGSIITITDYKGIAYKYKITDSTKTNIYGESIMQSINKSVIALYHYGSHKESICIQYCLPRTGLMIVWYGIKY